MYKLFNNIDKKQYIVRLSDNAMIPFDPANTDYQAYLKYIADGGEVLPADNTENT